MNNNNTFCISSAFYYPHTGGIETYTHRLCKELISKGFNVIILTHATNDENPGVKKGSFKETIVKLESYQLLNGRFPIYKNNKGNRQLFNYLKTQNINYFIINTRFYSLSKKTAELANSMNIKPILIDHGSAHLTLGNKYKDRLVQFVEHKLTNKLNKFNIAYYGISEASVEWLKHFNIKANGVLPNAIDAKEFLTNKSKLDIYKKLTLPNETFVVYFVGRYIPEKGIIQLINTAKSMSNVNNIHFIFSGEGPLKQLITEASKYPNIDDIGKIGIEDVAAVMSKASVLCLPTRSEGFCTTLLESAACKLPAIITNVGGVQELIKNNNYGYILEDSSENKIAEAITYMKDNKNLRYIMGKNINSEVIDNYNWNVVAKKIIEECKNANK